MSIAFSYVRFSSKKQEQGDSVRRQTALARAHADQHGLVLDERSYQDLGISAFKGKNAVEGALGAFIDAVDRGLIPKNATLLVESMDRLSRQEVDEALELFLSITRRGITIVTLRDGQSYSRASIKANWTKLIVALAMMAGANESSATKAMRVKQAWERGSALVYLRRGDRRRAASSPSGFGRSTGRLARPQRQRPKGPLIALV